jgi:hypothetical protein
VVFLAAKMIPSKAVYMYRTVYGISP